MKNAQAGPSQKTRFTGGDSRLLSAWNSFKHHLTPASHPSTTSSALESSLNHTDTYYGDSSFDHQPTNPSSTLPIALLHPTSSRIRRRKANKSSAGGHSTSRYGDDEDPNAIYEPVSHIVVDTNFEHFTPKPPNSDSGTSRTPGRSTTAGGEGDNNWAGKSEDELGDKEGMSVEDDQTGRNNRHNGRTGTKTKSEVSALETAGKLVQKLPGYEFIFQSALPMIKHFFDSSYPEPIKERSFQKETWFQQKQGALLSAAYFLISWALTVGLLPLPLTKFNWWAYFGLAGFFIVPILPMVIFDFPRRRRYIWQTWLIGATWVMSDILVGEMYECGFFSDNNTCGSRNFLNFLGFGYGLPTLAILALRQSRIMATFGIIQWEILVGVLLVKQGHAPRLFYRNMVNFGLFHAFLIGTSFLKERSDRQMFALRQQLKLQYRATQSAQVMEKRASDSKKRFVSYIFHEVRVPLNTALLAVQNLEGEEVFKNIHGDQSEMVHGLMGSLTMMEKVLNDVLSFNRMESGKFAQARKPFEFHKSIQLVALSHRMQAQMAGIDLIVDLDKDIDKIGGVFIGDEMRLRQVASNLVSNSIKFTDSGSVRIVTKLLYPRMEPTPATEIDDPLVQAARNLQASQEMEEATRMERLGSTTTTLGTAYDVEKGSIQLESRRMSRDSSGVHKTVGLGAGVEEERRKMKAVVRVEIHDTGVGLRKQDIIDNRLFSPYVQTEIGRRQGGKGSGLGLALVRQIVKLSNGRLGVESEFGKGSMFWFELPYSLPPPKKSSRESSVPPPVGPMGPGGGGNGGGGGGGSGTRSPKLSKSNIMPGVGTPILGMIEEATSPSLDDKGSFGFGATVTHREVERPVMVTSESTAPLLGSDKSTPRRSSDIGREGIITSTFPPVESESSAGSPDDTLLVSEREQRDFFRPESVDRRSSEEVVSPGPFLVTPVKKPKLAKAPSDDSEPPLCTLVVDDDKLTRMLMSRMLTRLGHQVTTAENGKIALDMIRDSFEEKDNAPKFDVVFLDNQMPLMSGVEVAREVREMGCPLFIVGCTGNALREDQEEYIAAGADEIIPKPIHQKSIEEMIKEARKRVRGETRPRESDGREM